MDLVHFEVACSDNKQGMKEESMSAKQYFHAILVHFGICKTTEELIQVKYENENQRLSCLVFPTLDRAKKISRRRRRAAMKRGPNDKAC